LNRLKYNLSRNCKNNLTRKFIPFAPFLGGNPKAYLSNGRIVFIDKPFQRAIGLPNLVKTGSTRFTLKFKQL